MYETIRQLLIFIKNLIVLSTGKKQHVNRTFGGLLALVLAILFVIVNFIGPGEYRKVLIDGDGSGLYAYLPAVFIYKTVDFTPVFEFEKSRRPPDYMGHNYHEINGTLINKFSCGTALLELPFFLLAWLLSLLLGLKPDGYNVLFQYATGVSALFWVWVGIWYFVRLAELYHLKKKFAWTLAITGLMGTNLLFYALIRPAASHVYSFALISVFLFYIKKVFLDHNRKAMYISSFILGLIVLIRPADILIVAAIPFIAGSSESFFRVIKNKLMSGQIFVLILLFILGLSPQLLINFLQTGKLLVYGYQHEGFYFSHPAWVNFLFSYRKGWFVYTPFMLLLIPATINLYRSSKYEFFTFLGFFLLLIYVFSSWWNWFYGDSFGMRPMVDFYGLFFLIIGLLLIRVKRKWILLTLYVFIGLTVILNLIQTYQYATGIIHPDSMNKKAYWKVFLKTSEKYDGIIAAADESFYGQLDEKPFFTSFNDMENNYPGWSSPAKPVHEPFSGHISARMDSTVEYSPSFVYDIPDFLIGKRNLYVRFDAMILENQPNATTHALFIVDIQNKLGKTVFYKKFKVKKLPDEITQQWRAEHIGFKLPEITDDMIRIKFYIWNLKHTDFLVDDMQLSVYEYRY